MSSSIIITFIAGILTGWILEWLFFTFCVKKTDDADAVSVAQDAKKASTVENVGAKKAEVKKAEITKTEVKKTERKKDIQQTSNTEGKAVVNEKEANKVSPKTTVKDESKEAAKKDADKKVVSNKETSKKESKKEATLAASKDKVLKTSSNEKVKQDTKTKSQKASTSKASSQGSKSDDLAILKGVGPKLVKSLSAIGLNSFSELAKLSGKDIVKQLEDAGHKVINKPALDNLAPQAKLAAKGDREGLKALQKSL